MGGAKVGPWTENCAVVSGDAGLSMLPGNDPRFRPTVFLRGAGTGGVNIASAGTGPASDGERTKTGADTFLVLNEVDSPPEGVEDSGVALTEGGALMGVSGKEECGRAGGEGEDLASGGRSSTLVSVGAGGERRFGTGGVRSGLGSLRLWVSGEDFDPERGRGTGRGPGGASEAVAPMLHGVSVSERGGETDEVAAAKKR